MKDYKELSEALKCSIRCFPIEYFGVPLGEMPRKMDCWRTVIKRCKRKLATWKANYISFGGRITLIKSSLSNLPIYLLSIFKIPKE